MNNNIKRLAIYGTIATLSLTNFSGCGNVNNKGNGEGVETLTTKHRKKTKKKEFLEYKHLIYKEVSVESMNRIKIPDGYEIYSIKDLGSDYHNRVFGVFYINNAKVKVKGTYNKQKGIYEYNHFGTVVKEKEVVDNKVIIEENRRLHLKK